MRTAALALAALLAAAACGGQAAAPAPSAGGGAPPAEAPSPGGGTPAATGAPVATIGAATAPAPTGALARHLTFELSDVRTGERFTLGGFGGKVVLVQAMAVW